MEFLYFFDDSTKFTGFGAENEIVFIDTDNWAVRWNLNYVEGIDLLELFSFGKGSTSHTRELIVKTEEVLERDGRKSHRFFFNHDTFFGFNSLVETFAVAATLHETTGVFVYNNNFAGISDDIVAVALENYLSA